MENSGNKRTILIIIFIMIAIIITGTFAWLSYRTNDTAMVLTIGEINSVQVTLSPYQINKKIASVTTYTSGIVTDVTAVNNSPSDRNIKLYYQINQIDSALAISSFKYVITKSTNGGSNYTSYSTGSFAAASSNSTKVILEESLPGLGTTYMYKVYLYLDGSTGNNSSAAGKVFNGELRAEIAEGQYQVTFNPNGGSVSPTTKIVQVGQSYGYLPTPTRRGYTFMGWNGKNLMNLDVALSTPSNTTSANTTLRTFTPNTYVKGLAFNNYYITSSVTSLNVTAGSVSMTARSGYGVAFPFLSGSDISYTLSFDTNSTATRGYSVLYYKSDGTLISYSNSNMTSTHVSKTFTTPASTHYLVVDFYGSDVNNTIILTNIQLEEKTNETSFEPYYVTSDVAVSQNKDHTLTAIWEDNHSLVPSQYQLVEYIQSSGTQYINTGYYWQHENIEIFYDGTVITNSSAQSLFGNEEYTASSGTNRNFSGIPHGSNGSYAIYLGSGTVGNVSVTLGTRFTLGIKTTTSKNVSVYKNDEKIIDRTYSGTVMTKNGAYLSSTTSNTVGNVFIFANHNSSRGSSNGGTQIISAMRLYSFKMYDNGVLVRNFVPCYRVSDNVAGLYDTVGNTFYTNAGSGTFTVGGNI